MRPYWHVDLKWIFGIFSAFFLFISLTLSLLSNLTAEKTAVPLITYIVASQFSRDGLDDPKDIEIAKQKLLNTGQDVFYPLPGTEVKITRSDLNTLSPREIRLKIFRQVVEPYYLEGVEQVANRTGKTAEERKQIKNQASLLGFINREKHEIIARFFLLSIIPVVVSVFGLVFFSYRYGRLMSPAVVFLLTSTIPAILLFLIQKTKPPLDAQGKSEGLPFLPYDVIQQLAASLAPPYSFVFLTGIALIATVFILKLSKRSTKKQK